MPKGYFYVLEVKSNVFFIIKIKDENHEKATELATPDDQCEDYITW